MIGQDRRPDSALGDAVVTVAELTKRYTYYQKEPGLGGSLRGLLHRQTLERRAVERVSFRIAPGEVVGFLGPNGAGKTTTLKMLCGLLYPTSGHVSVLGHTPSRREAVFLRRIALVMGQKSTLWWDVPAMETLLLHQEMYGIDRIRFGETLDELASMLDVTQLLRVPVRKLSLGERMKLELLAALLHRPDVLFLDEPTIGLDVVAQGRVRDFLRQLNQRRATTILLTSHDMDDIEALCPRVIVIDHGRIGYDGPLATLVARAAPEKRLTAVFSEPPEPSALAAALAGLLPIDTGDPRRVVVSAPRDRVADVASHVMRLGRVIDVGVEEAPVEEIIRELFTTSSAERSP